MKLVFYCFILSRIFSGTPPDIRCKVWALPWNLTEPCPAENDKSGEDGFQVLHLLFHLLPSCLSKETRMLRLRKVRLRRVTPPRSDTKGQVHQPSYHIVIFLDKTQATLTGKANERQNKEVVEAPAFTTIQVWVPTLESLSCNLLATPVSKLLLLRVCGVCACERDSLIHQTG